MDSIPQKACRICSQIFPVTREYFWTSKQNKDGFYTTCIPCSKVLASQYYHKNKAACNKRSVDWQKENPEKVKAIKQKTRKKNPDYEGQRIRSKRWRDRHPDRTRFYTAQRRTRVRNADGSHTPADIALQLKSQRGKCWWCGCKLNSGYHLDHIIPLDRGGSNWPNNIVIACSRCNQSRQNKLPHEWSDRLI